MDGHDQPTALKRARKAPQWHRWQSHAEAIWKDHPDLSRLSVALLVKKRLQLSQQADNIARRIPRSSAADQEVIATDPG